MSLFKKQIYQSFLKDNNFAFEKVNSKNVARCLKCNYLLKNTAQIRLQSHRNICGGTRINNVEKTKTQGTSTKDFTAVSSLNSCFEVKLDASSNHKNNLSTIDEKLVKFFIGCNIPFSIIESTLFKEFVNSLNVDYKPPCRKTLSSSFLNNLHYQISVERSDLDESDGVIVIDGWKNSVANTKNVVCIVHTSDESISDNAPVMTAMGKAVNLWHVETEVIKRGGTKMKLACETRWCSYRDAFQCCLKNLDIMKNILNEKLNKHSSKKSNKKDPEREKLLSIPSGNEETQEIVCKRINKVLTPILLAANLLHPMYQGKQFLHINEYRLQALQFIKCELSETSFQELEDYQNKLAQKLINIPASSAQIER
ncbi:hypothetical protein PV327_005187 [Microctonus hyperodae]|uniref:Uncharacterized protein n=1 Tax=Microctonus hyperodae TaxID=165561 RepID=A0AA39G1P7_MICHY|nr:hypothetical protein PV327_005187 [Microctonus hyperodae]